MNKGTFEWLENISRVQWDESYVNDRTILIRGEEIFANPQDYKPPFHIKILEMKGRMAIVKFSIGNFDYTNNIAIEDGMYYKFGRWALSIDSIDEKHNLCIITIRE